MGLATSAISKGQINFRWKPRSNWMVLDPYVVILVPFAAVSTISGTWRKLPMGGITEISAPKSTNRFPVFTSLTNKRREGRAAGVKVTTAATTGFTTGTSTVRDSFWRFVRTGYDRNTRRCYASGMWNACANEDDAPGETVGFGSYSVASW